MIPERLPVADHFTGVVLRIANSVILARSPLPGSETLISGDIILRYAVQYLGKPHLAVVPGLIVLDYGDMLTGEAAWEFLLKRSNLYPRADVLGYRADGTDDMVTIKALDLVASVQVLAYKDKDATAALSQVEALIAANTDDVEPRILAYLPHYHSINAWQQAVPHG